MKGEAKCEKGSYNWFCSKPATLPCQSQSGDEKIA